MALSGTDSYGNFLDTGSSTAITPRANVDIEVHTSRESDSGSSLPAGQTIVTFHPRGTPHRSATSPR